MPKINKYLIFTSIIIIIGFLAANERQFYLEKHINCPCKKGLLKDHDSPNAEKLKNLISELIQEPFIINSKFIFNNYKDLDMQDCLMASIKNNTVKARIENEGIYAIIENCYGKELIRNQKTSILYIIIGIILISGFIMVSIFIYKNTKARKSV